MELDTLQGWESGRRPLANMRAGALLELRRRLPALGADTGLVQWLDAAMDADRIIAAGLTGDVGGPHPLAGWVQCLVQAVEYRQQSYGLTQNWVDTSLASLKTPSVKALADAALSMDSLQWQHNFLPCPAPSPALRPGGTVPIPGFRPVLCSRRPALAPRRLPGRGRERKTMAPLVQAHRVRRGTHHGGTG
ncbi:MULTISPECIES: hypothetical protein [unclassified Streptomyces]|uniref:hypothetical protein n=1 Tax=unclassified Streptomyces TaxID=2593676 RepID=UPI000889A10A|nr:MULTISPECIES: hypothetical protein [unclassified Streptomyces]PBC80221.1 hypothetical protein BX261_0030 [Streptomyces sp. 2321.6]SDR59729.1 hypothetical protein SAMN05216511_7197 [Streptomyces sp. KS_16]SEB66512.1 hypothetical protein SAMN05428940_0030 [Streptomyces sp. 2133.1]SNC59357.1 hypothetical protein SAMN06272741_0033 [Streptomyces sp. 2114.4]